MKENELSPPMPQEENYKNMAPWPRASWETFLGLHVAALTAEPPNPTSNMPRNSFHTTGLRFQGSTGALFPAESPHHTVRPRQ